jgi:hypothetical protein
MRLHAKPPLGAWVHAKPPLAFLSCSAGCSHNHSTVVTAQQVMSCGQNSKGNNVMNICSLVKHSVQAGYPSCMMICNASPACVRTLIIIIPSSHSLRTL